MDTLVATLRQQRCVNHPQREASARCPECGRFYCRECITEHDDRVLCASCLAKLAVAKAARKARWAWIPRVVLAVVAFLVVFTILFAVGDFLVSIPSAFHDKEGF
jgi:hypothetical protein